MAVSSPLALGKLKTLLDRLYRTFDLEYLSPDPLEFVHRFKRPPDIEATGLIASALAYGRVETIRQSIGRVMDVMDWSPHGFVMGFRPGDKRLFSGFRHRFTDGVDMACLVYFMKQMFLECGSIEAFFLKGYPAPEAGIKSGISSFSARALSLDTGGVYGTRALPPSAGVRFLFPSPDDNSPCKRLNLFLRWMVRRDQLDMGLWKSVSPSRLVMPLDVHIARISRNIGLSSRKTPDWKMAEEITGRLRLLDPEDPVKYDFSLSRLGILEKCPSRKDLKKCEACLIRKICVL